MFLHPFPLTFSTPSSELREKGENGEPILFQSRKLLDLQPGKSDNCGFAAFAFSSRSRLLELKRRILERYKSLHPGESPSSGGDSENEKAEYPLVIAGGYF